MIVHGPTCTLAPSRALGSMIARGSIKSELPLHTEDLGCAGSLAVDKRLAVELHESPPVGNEPAFHDKLITRYHRPFETGFVGAAEIVSGSVRGTPVLGLEREHTRQLRHSFDNQYARHDGVELRKPVLLERRASCPKAELLLTPFDRRAFPPKAAFLVPKLL